MSFTITANGTTIGASIDSFGLGLLLSLSLHAEDLAVILEKPSNSVLGSSSVSEVRVCTQANTPISGCPTDKLRPMFLSELPNPEFFEEEKLAQLTNDVSSFAQIDDKTVLSAGVIEGLQWKILFISPVTSLGSRSNFFVRSVVALGVCLLVFFIFGLVFAFVITIPLNRVANKMKSMVELKFVDTKEKSYFYELRNIEKSFMVMSRTIQAFSRYIPKEVVEQVVRDERYTALGMDQKRLTIMFANLENFSGLTEKMDNEAAIGMLNSYLEIVTEVISSTHGTIDKFIGDSIMVNLYFLFF